MNRKYYMVLDTETVADARIPFDIAYTVIDRKGNIIERGQYFTAEVIDNPCGLYLLCKDSFSRAKADFYLTAAQEQPYNIRTFAEIKELVNMVIRHYDATVCAYNAKFDFTVCNNFAAAMGLGQFFANDVEVWDIWTMALYTLCASHNYSDFCDTHGFHSEKGNRKSSAETVYRYIANNPHFVEAHTALCDTEIEAEILSAIFRRKKKLHTDFCGCCAHRKPWKDYLKA